MKCIYHIHTSSNSYNDNNWTDEDYYLPDTEEEYNKEIKIYKEKANNYQNSNNAKIYGDWRIRCSDEGNFKAREYYYGHQWQGKNFDFIGVHYEEHLEHSNHHYYIIKPGTIKNKKECIDNSIGWMYGS